MNNTSDIFKNPFEPCHITDTLSPFLSFERKSQAHSDRLIKPLTDTVQEGTTGTEADK